MSITAEQLLKNKDILEEKTGAKTLQLKIKSLEGKFDDPTIEIKSIDMKRFFELREQGKNPYEVNKMVCYECITEPNLKDKDLQAGYGVKSNPYAIVEKFLSPSEINSVSDKIGEISGVEIDKTKVLIEEVKNE